jgi:hypothetical protein
MRRPQFSLKTLLWIMLVVAGFFAGLGIGRQRANDAERLLRLEAEQSRLMAEEHAMRALAAER